MSAVHVKELKLYWTTRSRNKFAIHEEDKFNNMTAGFKK
jgi:hypothetical protein